MIIFARCALILEYQLPSGIQFPPQLSNCTPPTPTPPHPATPPHTHLHPVDLHLHTHKHIGYL